MVERDEAEELLAEERKEVDGGAEGVLIFKRLHSGKGQNRPLARDR